MGDEATEIWKLQTIYTYLQAFVRMSVFCNKWNPLDSIRRVIWSDLHFKDPLKQKKTQATLRKNLGVGGNAGNSVGWNSDQDVTAEVKRRGWIQDILYRHKQLDVGSEREKQGWFQRFWCQQLERVAIGEMEKAVGKAGLRVKLRISVLNTLS